MGKGSSEAHQSWAPQSVLHQQKRGHHLGGSLLEMENPRTHPGPIQSNSLGNSYAHSGSSVGAGTGTPFVPVEAHGAASGNCQFLEGTSTT